VAKETYDQHCKSATETLYIIMAASITPDYIKKNYLETANQGDSDQAPCDVPLAASCNATLIDKI
jgi:hypothetical protein